MGQDLSNGDPLLRLYLENPLKEVNKQAFFLLMPTALNFKHLRQFISIDTASLDLIQYIDPFEGEISKEDAVE